MKQKKAHASHPVGNRTVIGIICIVVALAICFGIAPLVNRLSDGKTKIVRLTRDISAGATITEADIEVVDVGSYNLPTGVIKDKAQVVGKCALSNLTKGDYLFPSKIGNETNNAGRMLESLDENHKAISITIGSFALGFSGKLETGDIVGILVYDQVENRSYTPKELTYVIVDCTSDLEGNILAQTAIEKADQIIRLSSPDLCSISFLLSQLSVYTDSRFRLEDHIQGLNTPDADVYMPIEEAKTQLGEISFTLPFSSAVKEQFQQGRLHVKTTDKRFEARMQEIAGKVVAYGTD